MKKIVLICVIIFAGVGCTKVAPLCGCSPIQLPELMLVVKNAAGTDLLSDKNMGAYAKNDIHLYRKDASGNAVPLTFYIRPPFTYGNETFNFSTLYTSDVSVVKQSGESIYLKLGNDPAYDLKLQFSATMPQIDKLFINNGEAEKDNGTLSKYVRVFYLTK